MADGPRDVVIIGTGGFAREVLDIIDACNHAQPAYRMHGFIVDSKYGGAGDLVNGTPILGGFDWLQNHAGEVESVVAVGAPELRRSLVLRAEEAGARFFSLVHPSVLATRWIEWGKGVVDAAGCILTNKFQRTCMTPPNPPRGLTGATAPW